EEDVLEMSFSEISNHVEGEEIEITITGNRNFEEEDSLYDPITKQLNFYLSLNTNNENNIYPEVVSTLLDKNEIKTTIRIDKVDDDVKIHIKDNDGNVLGESNVFNVEEKPEFGTLFLKLDFRKQQQTSEDSTITFKVKPFNTKVTLDGQEYLYDDLELKSWWSSAKKIETTSCDRLVYLGVEVDIRIIKETRTTVVDPDTGLDTIVTNTDTTWKHINTAPYPILIPCNKATTQTAKIVEDLTASCLSEGKVPVLLVPGIMGSDTKWHGSVYPQIPKESPVWNSGELVIHDPGVDILNSWKPAGWENLRDELVSEGYKRNCNIIDVPYDWRLEIPQIRDQYLKPWIEEAKRRTGMDKVDIVAHSMGGLVARSYIQGENYQNDIRNFAMVGTPNKGAALSYPIWGGGDPIYIDEHYSKNGLFKPAKYFYTNTIYENYQEITEKSGLCIWEFGVSDTPIACNKEKVYDFVHKNVPSLGQLMPVYKNSFFNSTSGATSIEIEKNEFLFALNNGGMYKNETFFLPDSIKQKTLGNDIIFYSSKFSNTAYKINTFGVLNSGLLYKDGILDYIIDYAGDGTVPIVSVGIGGIEFADKNVNRQHGFLIAGLLIEITDFITSPVP
ncbi:MAG: hypothetical protein KAI16_02000, partial [Candidatus Pacebacteria bacterium]|nr:hypothetical protein [Candidatus Paceibacterota bacterium]